MNDTFRFEQDFRIRVNGSIHIVPRSEFLVRSRHISSLIVTGDPGCGKTTFMLDLCDSKDNYELVLVNQLASFDDLLQKINNISDDTFLLIDGIEDIECSPKQIAILVLKLIENGAKFALSSRGYLWQKVMFLIDHTDFTLCEINSLSDDQVLNYLSHTNIDIGQTLNLQFFKNPFYLSLLADNGDILEFSNVCQFMDSVIENQVRSVCLKFDVDTLQLLNFLEDLAMRMRANGVKSIHYDLVLSFLKFFSLSEDYLGNISFLQKSGYLYKFSHELFLDFLVAKVIYKGLFLNMDLKTYAGFQTSYQEDKFISIFVGESKSLVNRLVQSLANIKDPVLKVNILGMLAKINGYDTQHIWHELMINDDVYSLYKKAVFERINTTEDDSPSINDIEGEIHSGDDPIAALVCQKEIDYACN